MSGRTVLLTDHPWPELDIERETIEGSGFQLVAGPVEAQASAVIDALVADVNPLAILTCWGVVSSTAVGSPSDLRIVARMGVGLDNIAVQAATARGAWVTNVPDYCVGEVSDHAIALILAHYRGVVRLDAATKRDGWRPAGEGLQRIADLTVGVIGYGRIGRETSRKLKAFGCRILAVDPSHTESDGLADAADLAMVAAEADVVVLHAPLLPTTTKLVNAAFLGGCRRRPLIVNVSRGGLVDNGALLDALEAGRIRGAALDVLDGEPSPPSELYRRPDVIATPHIAFASTASLNELRRRACEEVVRVLDGQKPHHPCNAPFLGVALPGGVASDIRVVQTPGGPEVVKRALPKLKVSAEWFAEPSRSSTEVNAIRAFAELIGSRSTPEILWTKPDEHVFAMRLVEPRFRNWKAQLLAGHVDAATASTAGELLGRAHRVSGGRRDLERRFADTTHFEALRIEPFFVKVGQKLPHLADAIGEVVRGMASRRSALVHGDFSPKNILADGAEIVILDYEVAHWGDPRFDVGFCVSHLLLKSFRKTADRRALLGCIDAFLAAYTKAGPFNDDADLVRVAGCLMLARFDGSSPVEYLAELDGPAARALAESMVTRPLPSLTAQLATLSEMS